MLPPAALCLVTFHCTFEWVWSRAETVSQFGRILSLSGPTATFSSPEQADPQPFSGCGEEQSLGSVAPSSARQQCLSQLHAQEHVGGSSKELIPPKKCYSLHDTQTYCLNKALCGSAERGEEDEVLILIMQECYLALQVPHQHS